MQTLRYHNRSTDGRVFTEAILNGESYRASVDMGFIELPDTEIGRDYARSLCLEPMEGEPALPVVLADPRMLQRHAQEISDYEARLEAARADADRSIEQLDKRCHELTNELDKAKAERDTALADKTRLLENYERALAKIEALGTAGTAKVAREMKSHIWTPPAT